MLELDEFQDLDLSDHQKMMLLPVDARIGEIVYPASIQARVQAMPLNKTGLQKKSKWNAKFKGVFAGKLAQKWKLKICKATGIKKSTEILSKKLGPVVTIKKPMGKKKPGPTSWRQVQQGQARHREPGQNARESREPPRPQELDDCDRRVSRRDLPRSPRYSDHCLPVP